MEETDMCHSIPAVRALQQAIPNNCTAKTLGGGERLSLGVQALAGHQTITNLAGELGVSRKFVYRQAATAQDALNDAFLANKAEDEVLFHVPVTKAWLRQATLGLALICHSSYRGIHEFWRDLFDVSIAVGTVHNIMQDAVAKARPHNDAQDLANVRIAALDEIFQNGRPALVGADADSTYCFLLSAEDHRDADTWGVRLLELIERNFAPKATIADFAAGIRAGQKLALLGSSCRGDTFHALYEVTPVGTFLENRAYDRIADYAKLQHKKGKLQAQARKAQVGQVQALARKAATAAQDEAQAVKLADDIALLTGWLQYDLLAVSGMPYADRVTLYDFVVAEFRTRESLCPHRIKPVCTLLQNQRDCLLAFAADLEIDLTALAEKFQVPLDIVRAILDVQAMDQRDPRRQQQEDLLRAQVGERFSALSQAVQELADAVVRASSVIENINSRVRPYIFLRRDLHSDHLTLLQFFLNHRRFLRSERPDRVGKSPAELLTGVKHPHWLEMLGFTLFSRN
jgi:hypothetical protein